MISYEDEVKSALDQVLTGLGIDQKADLESSPNIEGVDYSTSIALRVSKLLGKNPLQLAQDIARDLRESFKIEAEAASPGFVNIKIPKEFFSTLISYLLDSPEKIDLTTKSQLDRKVIVEYTDPNPFKEFHIGHMYSNAVGESIARLLDARGADVRRACYQGDVGVHVAKAIWGMQKTDDEMPDEKASLSQKAAFLGKAYSVGARAYEEDDTKKEIDALNKKVYERDEAVVDLYDKGKRWSLEYFDSLYQKLGTRFDKMYFESEAAEEGLRIVKENTPRVFTEDQGAVVFRGEEHGLHTRVFVNSTGLPTYEAKELGLAPLKYKDFPYDKSIIITGNEVDEYFKVLFKALSLIEFELAERTVHLSHGMVRLPGGKISSRTGDVITAEAILSEIEKAIGEKFEGVSNDNLSAISVGAAKYALLKSGLGKDIVFDLDESISLNGNSGPYLQYAYARTQSILSKKDVSSATIPQELSVEERNLLRDIAHFGEVVDEAATNFSPSSLATYLFGLAQNFNLFYQKEKVIGSDSEEFRLALVKVTGAVLKRGLFLLGIEAPQRI